MVLIILEILAFLATAVLAVLWVRDSAGNYEPWIVICGVVGAVIEFCRWFRGRPQSDEDATIESSNINRNRKSKPDEIVDWIQEHGTEKPLSQILPRALQLAQLVEDHDMEHWVRMELYGYNQDGGMTEQDTVPEYRDVNGRYMNQYGQMLQIDDPRLDFVNSYRFRYGVRKLEELAKKTDMINIRDESMIQLIREHLNVEVFQFRFSPVEITGLLDHIRNRLLEKVSLIRRNKQGDIK